MSGRFKARNKVAMAGFAHSKATRTPDRPLGMTALDTARAAIADAGLRPEQIDGFVSSPLLPTTGDHQIEDGISTVTSNWLAKHLGLDPAYVVGFQGIGQITGSLTLAVNAIASGAADYVLFHRALHLPPGKYNDNALTQAAGGMQWMAPMGFFGAMPAIALAYNEYCQRYGAKREAMATLVSEARKNGSRIPWSAWHRQAADGRAVHGRGDDHRADVPVRRRHAGGRRRLLRAHQRGARAGTCRTGRSTFRAYASGYPTKNRAMLHWTLDDMMEAGKGLSARLWESSGLQRERDPAAAALRRVLAVRLHLAGDARLLQAGRGARADAFGRDRQRQARQPCRSCRAAARSATGGCTACRRCSNAISSFRAARANGRGKG
jgi:hypothetical protein